MTVFGRILCGVLLLSICLSATAENYKCKQANGSIAYQDTPCIASSVAQQLVNPPTGSVLGLTMSELVMIGVRKAARKGADRGELTKTMAVCLAGLGNDRLYSTFQHLLAENINAPDLRVANTFFNSAAGQKFARRNVVRADVESDETPTGPEPIMSAAEENEVSEFTATPAGQKLIKQRFMSSSESLPVVLARVHEFYNECGTVTVLHR